MPRMARIRELRRRVTRLQQPEASPRKATLDLASSIGDTLTEMASTGFIEFRDALFARHENAVTSRLSIVGDLLLITAVPAGLATRSVRVSLRTFAAGYLVAVIAHLFQPGTVRDEVLGVARHPIWAARAEGERVRNVVVSLPDVVTSAG